MNEGRSGGDEDGSGDLVSQLGEFIDASPTPFHAVEQMGKRLLGAGFELVDEASRWPAAPGRYFLTRGGSLIAWSTQHFRAAGWPVGSGFTVVGGHTDSPNLRIKPHPDIDRVGWQTLGVEVYGGPLLSTWFDRDLGISGRVAVRDRGCAPGYSTRLFRADAPLARVANLAIHLDRSAADGSAPINKQEHLPPLWGLGQPESTFGDWLAAMVGVEAEDVLAYDAMLHDLAPSALIGPGREMFAAPRLDNLASAFAGTCALIAAVEEPASDGPARPSGTSGALGRAQVPVLAMFDHEEIGSRTHRGADSQLLAATLERIVATTGGDRTDALAAFASSLIVSADMAHATHPNYAHRHDGQHEILAGGGPVLKVNAQGRYATDCDGGAAFALACERAQVPLQRFVNRTDLPCGSTIGPMSASLTGAVTVDVGAPMLSMHSIREVMAARDIPWYVQALGAVLGATTP